MNFIVHKRAKILLKDSQHNKPEKHPFDSFYYKEIAKLTAAGGWCVDFKGKASFLDPQARRILNVPEDYRPSLKTALDFYAPEDKAKATQIFFECSMGTPFNTTVKMLTFDKKELWARATGQPVFDGDGSIIGIRGVFQDINDEKLRELSVEKSLQVISQQNGRLLNFAHIVSHNLRSHSSNFQLTLDLLNTIESKEEELELMESLRVISNNLNTTIHHLNEVVTIQSKATDSKKEIELDKVLQHVKGSIQRDIHEADATIYSDFSEVPIVTYIPAYLESIFFNLLTNAIKYRHPDRPAVIDVFTTEEDMDTYLIFKDNGRGIDLDVYGERVFNMYQTFHNIQGSVGIGLFITKNQIESQNGTIEIESKVDLGTTFKIKL